MANSIVRRVNIYLEIWTKSLENRIIWSVISTPNLKELKPKTDVVITHLRGINERLIAQGLRAEVRAFFLSLSLFHYISISLSLSSSLSSPGIILERSICVSGRPHGRGHPAIIRCRLCYHSQIPEEQFGCIHLRAEK